MKRKVCTIELTECWRSWGCPRRPSTASWNETTYVVRYCQRAAARAPGARKNSAPATAPPARPYSSKIHPISESLSLSNALCTLHRRPMHSFPYRRFRASIVLPVAGRARSARAAGLSACDRVWPRAEQGLIQPLHAADEDDDEENSARPPFVRAYASACLFRAAAEPRALVYLCTARARAGGTWCGGDLGWVFFSSGFVWGDGLGCYEGWDFLSIHAEKCDEGFICTILYI